MWKQQDCFTISEKNAVECNQGYERTWGGDVQSKIKQMTHLSITGAFNCTHMTGRVIKIQHDR